MEDNPYWNDPNNPADPFLELQKAEIQQQFPSMMNIETGIMVTEDGKWEKFPVNCSFMFVLGKKEVL